MPNDILTRAIDEICAGTHLTADHTSAALAEIMEGRASEVQTAAFLISLRAKGETVSELVGLARTMRSLAAHVEIDKPGLVDTAGTGGGPTTFNISTTAALIAAGAGCPVAKHGNRSATGPSGSADLLEALGVEIELSPAEVATCIEEIIADALRQLGRRRALVVSADDGIDELSIASRTRVIEVADGGTEEWFADASEFGLKPAPLEAIPGGEPAENAALVRAVREGEAGPARDVWILNAGAAIYVAGGAADLGEGVAKAAEAIDSGAARDVLGRLV